MEIHNTGPENIDLCISLLYYTKMISFITINQVSKQEKLVLYYIYTIPGSGTGCTGPRINPAW